MSKKLNISKSAYYKWIYNGKPVANNINNVDSDIISVEHYNNKEVYGVLRLKEHIAKKYEIIMNHKKIRRYKCFLNLETKVRKKRKMTFSNKKPDYKCMARNLLKNNFTSTKKFEKLSTDVSYIKCTDGLLYLSAVKDLFNNQIISYYISNRNDVNLVVNTLKSIPNYKGIIHSDQGSLYYSYEYKKLVKDLGYERSMSRRGACWENSPIENWFSQLKEEQLRRIGLKTMKETKEEIKKYIHWYNNERIQKCLGYKSPLQFID